MKCNYLIVGSGLTGAVIARNLADSGESVVVLDRRPHLGGNVADVTHPSGIQIHRYGPHLFRTASSDIWRFVNRFAHFHCYRHTIKSRVDGALENWPIAGSYISRACGANWRPARIGDCRPRNFEEAALSLMPAVIYEKFVKGYSEKQWGVHATALSASLCQRFDVRYDDDPYLHSKHKHQGIPTEGYSKLMERMLAGIPVILNFDYLKDRHQFKAGKQVVFTGPIDEYFDFELGHLSYRGQQREHTYDSDAEMLQPCAQVNEPSADRPHIRDIEWKHLMEPNYAMRIRGTVITRETPWSPVDPDHFEYPFPDEINQSLFAAYKQMAAREPGVLVCGRLGEYRYYDMDHAIGRAMTLSQRLLAGEDSSVPTSI
jgi:UDP-galactopyranose mutase